MKSGSKSISKILALLLLFSIMFTSVAVVGSGMIYAKNTDIELQEGHQVVRE